MYDKNKYSSKFLDEIIQHKLHTCSHLLETSIVEREPKREDLFVLVLIALLTTLVQRILLLARRDKLSENTQDLKAEGSGFFEDCAVKLVTRFDERVPSLLDVLVRRPLGLVLVRVGPELFAGPVCTCAKRLKRRPQLTFGNE